jgi:hypothetical protein
MRIAVVSAPSRRQAPPDYVQTFAKGMELMGHTIEIIDAWTDNGMRLSGCNYIAIITTPASFFSAKIPDLIPKILSIGGGVGGKKSAAFVKREGLRSNKTLANLMRAMEKEGMIINWCDILYNAPHAQEMGKRIGA